MNKFLVFICLIILLSIYSSAQWIIVPKPYLGLIKTQNKGDVHTILTIEQRGEEVFSTVVEVFDRSGKLIERMFGRADTTSKGFLNTSQKSALTYDKNGKLLKETFFTLSGKLNGYDIYFFDARNRLIKIIEYDNLGKYKGDEQFEYFPEKREVLRTVNTVYKNRKIPSKILFTYNEKEQLIKRGDYNSKNKIEGYTTYEYDLQGNFIKEIYCCNFNYSHLYSYEFDKSGNWIEQKNTLVEPNKNEKDSSNPDWMRVYRAITYYSE